MDDLGSKSKEFKYIWTLHNPMYARLLVAIQLVKDFITSNNLIIYGGEALDYALRLKGDHIYPDELLTIPDLDFFSPDSVAHSYQLADIFYKNGFEAARAIVAIHVHTMKVDCGSNNFMADLSYIPHKLFETVPTLTYNNMRVVHPDYQRIDLHIASSFIYSDPPKEVVFNRLKKDIQRFNKVNHHYPIVPPDPSTFKIAKLTKIDCVLPNTSFCGLTAFSILRRLYDDLVLEAPQVDLPHKLPAHLIPAAKFVAPNLHAYNIEFAYDWSSDPITTFGLEHVSEYEPFHNIVPHRIEATIAEQPVHIRSTQYKLLASNEVLIDGQTIEVANVQYVLNNLIAEYHHTNSSIHLYHYAHLLHMIENVEHLISHKANGSPTAIAHHVAGSPFFPTTRTYGSANESTLYHIAISRLNYNKDRSVPQPKLPTNYNVKKYAEKHPNETDLSEHHPTFDYRSSPYFQDDGLPITKDSTEPTPF